MQSTKADTKVVNLSRRQQFPIITPRSHTAKFWQQQSLYTISWRQREYCFGKLHFWRYTITTFSTAFWQWVSRQLFSRELRSLPGEQSDMVFLPLLRKPQFCERLEARPSWVDCRAIFANAILHSDSSLRLSEELLCAEFCDNDEMALCGETGSVEWSSKGPKAPQE